MLHDAALRQRGSLTICFTEDGIKARAIGGSQVGALLDQTEGSLATFTDDGA